MKFDFKKITSVLASAVMLGSTLGIAAAANYPAPFIQGGSADVAVVVTSGNHAGSTSDFLSAVDLGQDLQAELAKQTATSTTTSASSSGGDSQNIATASQAIYKGSALNTARSTLTDSELPSVLADGTAVDNSGVEYDYTQKLTLGTRTVAFTKSSENMDPVMLVDVGATVGNTLYNYTLTLTKVLNVSATDVIGTAELIMLGQSYVVGANSDYNTLYLYGSGTAATVDEGEEETVTVSETEHTVMLKGTSSTTAATIVVDGTSKSVTKGNSYKFAGEFEVYIKDVFHATKTGTLSSVDLLLGANTLHFESGQAVRKGADDTTIDKTTATITGTDGQGINSITVAQAAKSTTGDYIEAGGEYTDRVFGGLKVQFAGVNAALDASSRTSVVVDTDNAVSARVTFDSGVAGIGEEQITYGVDSDRVSDSALGAINLVDSGNFTMHVVEGANAKVDELIMIHNPAKDEGRILRVGSIPGTSYSASDYVRMTDVLNTEDYWDFKVALTNVTSASIDGETYYIYIVRTGDDTTATANLTWGSGSASGNSGTQTTLFPRIKLENGAWISFLTQTTLVADRTYQVPGEYLLSGYTTGAVRFATTDNVANDSANGRTDGSFMEGNINYTLDTAVSNTSSVVWAISGASTNDCVFNSSIGPAILIMEEKTLADSNGYGICIPLTSEGTTTKMAAVGAPVFTDGTSSLLGLSSNTYKGQQVTTFGTHVERDTTDNNVVTVSYPDEQMYADVLFTAPEVTVTAGTSGSGSVTELGSVTIKDSEVSSVQSKNLIVVGGSCINSVASKILGGGYCGADFTSATGVGSGQFLIKVVDSPYTTGKVAMLVAGYDAADTSKAVKYLTTESPATDVDTELKKVTTTYADVE
jgi:hypothetical protein